MGLLDTLRKYCIMKSVRDKAKNTVLEPDKYAEKMTYVGISLRDITHTLTIEKLQKEVDKNIDPYINKLSTQTIDELESLYEDVKHSKNTFRESIKKNVWADFSVYGEKTDIIYHGFKRLQDCTKEEIEKRKNS